MQETQKTCVQSLGWKIPWGSKWQPTPVFLSRKFSGYNLWDHKVFDVATRNYTAQNAKGPRLTRVSRCVDIDMD